MSNCNVTFWKDQNFEGHYKNYDGPTSKSDLNEVQWHGQSHDDMKDDIRSIQTSSETWVRVYSKANYSGRTALIGPNENKNMSDVRDDNNEDDMDKTIESFQLYDHKPNVNTTNIINNLKALYPGSDYNRLNNLYNSEYYAQDSQYRIYDPEMLVGADKISFTINMDHIQLEHDDHAVVTLSMDYRGDFVDRIQVVYTMADASQIPDWAIKIIDGAIDVADDAAKILADGAEIVITDGVGVVATVETNEVIDFTAKVLTFCVDHLNTVLSAVFTYQDDGGTMNFPAAVSHGIARCVLAYHQELFGKDSESQGFNESNFLAGLGASSWNYDKHNPSVGFSDDGFSYRAYYPDNSFFYANGGALSSVKIDAVTGVEKDDHLILQASFDPQGRMFSVVGSIDLFARSHSDGYTAPASGVLTFDENHRMILIDQAGTVTPVNYASLADAYADQMRKALDAVADDYNETVTDQQRTLVDASLRVLAAIDSAI
ncbi:MAG: peptidase inhibitor family I36 protein [Xanthomonadaceae bacterium]|nr:peptidase inhibitor family I36 protein [Xanthomonadaceae bacterium]